MFLCISADDIFPWDVGETNILWYYVEVIPRRFNKLIKEKQYLIEKCMFLILYIYVFCAIVCVWNMCISTIKYINLKNALEKKNTLSSIWKDYQDRPQ